jgi:glycosyltransferase involved in cell wall biosynthesis
MAQSFPLLLHLSHAADASDGGIAIAVGDLIAAQQSAGLKPQWITADCFPPLRRDRELAASLQASASALVHLHGLWRSPTRFAARLAPAGRPLLIAPHGMLDPAALAISRRKKQLVWQLWERRALQAACCLQALCPAEAQAIRVLLPRARIAVIPNGVQIPNAVAPTLPAPPWAGVIPSSAPVLLFFGRFHAKKGIEPLLKAWQAVATAAERSGWWLALVGYGDDGALQRLVDSAQARGELPQVFVGGPAFAADKASVLHGASAFVLPSFSEGLPMAALEAMANQLPCLLSSACNLPEAFSMGAALPSDAQPEALAGALQQLFALNLAERNTMGAAGRALVAEHYSWPQVAEQTKELYRWILGGGEQPAFLHHR